MEIIEEYKAKIISFLSDNKSPSIKTATTMKDGCVVCISPVPTICGAELMCHPNTRPFLIDFVNKAKGV
jgi:hypothetical protein